MIIIDDQSTIILHVPRTGGTALSRAVAEAIPNAVIIDGDDPDIHMGIQAARAKYPCDRYIAVMRSPWEKIASNYSMLRHVIDRNKRPPWLASWQDTLGNDLDRIDFAEFIRRTCETDMFRPSGGFGGYYVDDDTIVVQYADDPIKSISELLGVELKPHRTNGDWPKPAWTRETINLIAAHDHEDISRYGYTPPELPGMITRYSHRADLYAAVLPRNAIGVELGVSRGDNARVLVDTTRPEMLHLVDNYAGPAGDDMLNGVRERFANDRVELHRSGSAAWMMSRPSMSLDWIYVDTSHTLQHTRAELRAVRGKVRSVVAGHDFCQNRQHRWGVVEAVIEEIQAGHLEMIAITTDDICPSFACRVIT